MQAETPGTTVLVVDDNPATLYSTGRVLRAAGFNVLEASTGLQACALAEQGTQLVVLDVHLPDIDGFEVCRRIRSNPRTSRIPVLHLSATFVRDMDKVHGLEAGADGYLTHPVEPPVLIATMNAFLRARRAEEKVRESLDRLSLAVQAADLATWDWDVLADRMSWSGTLAARQGVTPEQAPRSLAEFTALIHPDDRERVRLDLEKSLLNGSRFQCEFRMIRSDGWVRWVSAMAAPVRGPDGRVTVLQGVELDITERKQADAALRSRERELRSVADNIPDVLARFDRELRYVFINQAISKTTLLDPSQFLGKTNRELGMPPDLCEPWDAELRVVFDTGRPKTIEFAFDSAEGPRHFASRLIPEHGPDGRVDFVLCITQDVTESRQQQVAVERARAEAERANAAKDRFLAALSHELRTPLNPVLMAVAALRHDATLPAGVRDDMEMIHRNVRLETQLIDDLLDVTRIAHGKILLRSDRVNLPDRVREVIRMVESDASVKRISVTMESSVSRAVVIGDAARLQQVIWNLLNNAIKFTPAGGKIRAVVDTVDDRVRLSVIDNGVGIDPAILPQIFEPFEQGGDTVTRRFGGLGLGLSISRALIDMHGGTLHVASEGLGRGASFTFELPLAPADPADSAGKPAASGSGGKAKALRILLVEDHADTARMMARVLKTFGHGVAMADSVAAALRHADEQQMSYDVVISDVGLPDGTGHELMRQLLDRFPQVRGIALTGYGSDEDVRQSVDAGFVAHLTKPVDVRDLEDTINQVARGR